MSIDGITPRKRPGAGGDKNTQANDYDYQEPTFEPPEIVAEKSDEPPKSDNIVPLEEPTDTPARAVVGTPKKHTWFHRIHLSKKQAIILSVVLVLLLGGGGAAAYVFVFNKKKPTPAPVVTKTEPKVVEPPKPTTVASPLTGIQVQPSLAQLPVTGIMIENSPDARPQSGLKDAGIVYEAIAEGGITRFLTLFQESQPDYVGPVRSARPYYLEWLQGYDASIAHVGGSPEALALIKSAGIKDLDQFYNSGAYHRISTRYAPHNVYTSLASLIDLEKTKGYTKSTFTGFARKVDKPVAPVTGSSIDFTLSGYLYNVHYDYDAAANSYKRSEGGKPHTDEKSGAQLEPKVVIALVMPYALEADGLHSDYSTTGSGRAFIFQDGGATAGTWSKASSKAPLLIGDANSAPLALNAGQTWITVVGTEGSVAYK
jgi:hypothetical protein